jgi:hypothetical protein
MKYYKYFDLEWKIMDDGEKYLIRSFKICTLLHTFYDDQTNNSEIGGICSTYER